MADTAPPVYDDNAPPPAYTREEKIEIQVAATIEVHKPEVRAQLEVDLEAFTRSVKEIEDGFRVVENKLGEIDAKGFDNPFQPQWIKYRGTYNELLAESQMTANEIATEAEKFGKFILPYVTGKKNPEHNPQSRIDEIDLYLDESKDFQQKAESLRQRFADLAKAINEFKGTFSTFAEKQRKQTSQELNKLNTEIAAAKKRIEELNFQLPLLIGGLGILALGSIALCLIFPMFAGAIAKGALVVAGAIGKKLYDNIQERKETSANLALKESEAKEKAKVLGEIDKARQDLRALAESEISKVAGGISMLSEFWRTVNQDAKEVASYLKQTKKEITDYQDDPSAPIVLVSYLKSGADIYSGLSQGLRAYSMGITKAKSL
ncbi:hypothetical protein FRB91_002852 [Serendipita sp. 411]|nr:hypothetical protein FRC15_005252 [Serendipita sp. 397]KAG8774702.1 hypothetical protein FRC16_005016 [Serendipita sp. 398]KAG8844105.1 hypothetical protein FRB91_002852 [Serendipita sp. 411]KAG8862890.1 hypothetical protein FRC20_010967 [Serendipita sp. 405]